MSFYLHLPSNVSPKYYPDNRISSFQVKLPKRLTFFPDEYEVSLTEISYINSRKVIFSEKDRLVSLLVNVTMDENPSVGTAVKIPIISNKNYRNINDLLQELNNTFRTNQRQTVSFTLKQGTKRVCIDVIEGWIKISEAMARYLGFGDTTEFELGEYEGWEDFGRRHEDYHMFVYCDIISPQIVGDTMVPLLRLLTITGSRDEAVTQTFRPYYLPLSRLDFDCIAILLCNEFGEELQFDKGQAILTLHFRKK
jgi:hypothetical protein